MQEDKTRGNYVSAQLMNPGFHGFDPYPYV